MWRRSHPAATVVLTLGCYGVQARSRSERGLGDALDGAYALPMILSGTDLLIARTLVSRGD